MLLSKEKSVAGSQRGPDTAGVALIACQVTLFSITSSFMQNFVKFCNGDVCLCRRIC